MCSVLKPHVPLTHHWPDPFSQIDGLLRIINGLKTADYSSFLSPEAFSWPSVVSLKGVPSSRPQSAMTTGLWGALAPLVSWFSMVLRTFSPSSSFPKTTWRPFSQGVSTVVIKNWLPLVLGPTESSMRGSRKAWLSLAYQHWPLKDTQDPCEWV